MLEPAVTLSDFAVSAECMTLAVVLTRRQARGSLPTLFIALFLTTAVAAFIGALVHGWFPDQDTATYKILWPASMLLIGATGAVLWLIGITLLDGTIRTRTAVWVLAVLWAGYAVFVIFINQKFYVALAAYVPGTVFLGAVFLKRYLATRSDADRWGSVGIALTLAAGAVQYFGVAPHPLYFDHNALYHAIEAIALLALYLAARNLAKPR